MTILDSSVWIALLHETDSQHRKAEIVFDALKDTVIVPEYIILEVTTVLSLRASATVATAFLDHITNTDGIEVLRVGESLFTDTMLTFKKFAQRKVSFVDAALICLAAEYSVITFDKTLERILRLKQKHFV